MGNALKAVIFDLGKVLVDFDWQRAVMRLAPHTSLPPEAIEPTAMSCGAISAYETGRLDTATFCQRLTEELQVDLPPEELVPIYSEIFQRRPKMEALFEEVRAQLPVAILSDTSPMHWQEICRLAPPISRPDVLTVSYEVGVCKPDSAMYETVVAALGVRAEDCLFIDDRMVNVEGAGACGLQAIPFSDEESVCREIRARLATPT